MVDARENSMGWEVLGEHQGIIVSLDWSSLFCGSYDGEIRNWLNGKYQVIQDGASTGSSAGEKGLADLAWSQSEKKLIVSVVGGLAIYKNGAGQPLMIPEIKLAAMLRCNTDGTHVASRELQFNKESKQYDPKLMIRSTNSLADHPLLDSDLFMRSEGWLYDFAWSPGT